jgi:tetratricopeptide (TPR) repeat protein
MNMRMITRIVVLTAWLFPCIMFSQSFPRGQIVERVFCLADSSQSYSLYLPSNYDSAKAWPIMYCFKPETNAVFPLSWYSEIMEQYGYIMVCSWNSQNGPWQVCIDALHSVWKDTHSRFHIDSSRVYTTGFSGGSRTAAEMAIRYPDQVTGVIGMGAGFSQWQEIPDKIPFDYYYGMAGYRDYNHSEMTYLDGILNDKKLTHRIAYFDGVHQWVPPEDFRLAVEWMELHAMRNGQKFKNMTWIEKRYREDENILEKLLAEKKIHDAAIRARWMNEDFRDFLKVERLISLYDSLKNTEEFIQWEEVSRSLHAKEVDFQNAFDNLLNAMGGLASDLHDDPNFKRIIDDKSYWQSLLRSKEPLESQAAYRCLDYVSRYSKANGRGFLMNGDYKRAAFCFDLAVKMFPNDSSAYYWLSSTYARSGDISKSVSTLEKALKYGFRDLERIQTDPNLELIRNDKNYRRIIKELTRKIEKETKKAK